MSNRKQARVRQWSDFDFARPSNLKRAVRAISYNELNVDLAARDDRSIHALYVAAFDAQPAGKAAMVTAVRVALEKMAADEGWSDALRLT